MLNRLKQPCNDCPFRRVSAPGWLGGGTGDEFVRGAFSDRPLPADERAPDPEHTIIALPCHLTIDYDNDDWRETLEDADVCIGALQFAANACVLPRDAERAALVSAAGRNPDVFGQAVEFLAHHAR